MARYSDIYYDSADLRLKLYARDYGRPSQNALPVLCMHGLTRNSADFEWLADHLASDYWIISVDQRGRGKSAWDDQQANYSPAVYVQDMFKLMGELSLTKVALIGTSMGGIMAMIMGAMAPQVIAGLVINDVGPELDPSGLARIAGYTGKGKPVETWEEAGARCAETNSVAFPDFTPADWLMFAKRTYSVTNEGRLAPAYDPAISNAFAPTAPDTPPVAPPDLWGMWDALKALPTLSIRGGISDLLSAETVTKMEARHSGLAVVTVPDRGHAPMLDEPVAVTAIDSFLSKLDQ